MPNNNNNNNNNNKIRVKFDEKISRTMRVVRDFIRPCRKRYQLVYEADKKWYVVRKDGHVVCQGACDVYRAKGDAIRVIALSSMRQVIVRQLGVAGWLEVRHHWNREWKFAVRGASMADHEDDVLRRLGACIDIVRECDSKS